MQPFDPGEGTMTRSGLLNFTSTGGAEQSAPLDIDQLMEMIGKVNAASIQDQRIGRMCSSCCFEDVRLGRRFGEAWCLGCGSPLAMRPQDVLLDGGKRVLSFWVPESIDRGPATTQYLAKNFGFLSSRPPNEGGQ